MLLEAESPPREEIALRDLVIILWRERLLFILLTVGCAVMAMAMAIALPKQYRAVIQFAPVTANGSSSKLLDQASSLSDITSLMGISLGGDTAKYESVAVLQSRVLTGQYISSEHLLPVLLPGPHSFIGRRLASLLPPRRLTLGSGVDRFDKIRNVTEDKRTGLFTLTITWTDPVLAARWANDLVRLTNDYLRSRAIQVSDQHISYLTQQATTTDVAEVRSAIYSILESEIKNVMLAKGPGDYALKVIDPASPPEFSASPKVGVWVLVGFCAGMFAFLLVLFIRNAMSSGGNDRRLR